MGNVYTVGPHEAMIISGELFFCYCLVLLYVQEVLTNSMKEVTNKKDQDFLDRQYVRRPTNVDTIFGTIC